MNSYSEVFGQLKQQGRTALIPFFVIGDPDFETSLDIVKAAIDSGADVLELGIPFSDPIADGPTIQKADIRAMKAGMSVSRALEFIADVKQHADVPIGLLMYYNLVYQYGVERFFEDFHRAGVNSVLVADLSVDDAEEIVGPARQAGLDTVFMVTPVTSDQRIKMVTEQTTGFVYTVSVLGVTGSRDELSGTVGELVSRIKTLTDVPVCVGFGISKAQHAVSVARAGADGVIIGSRVVAIIEENLGDKAAILAEISGFLKSVRDALDAR